ncbi:MAG: signal peptidase I [Candidatus Limnocylindria bacterium]
MKRSGKSLSIAALVLLFGIFLGIVGLRLAGISTFIVMGASMEPTIPVGSLALVKAADPAEVTAGQVITYRHDGITTTHRVISAERIDGERVFTTKGDANDFIDSERIVFSDDVGLVLASVPAVGFPLYWLYEYWRVWMAGLAGIVFFWCAYLVVFRPEPVVPGSGLAPRRRARLPDIEKIWSDHQHWIDRRPRGTRAA